MVEKHNGTNDSRSDQDSNKAIEGSVLKGAEVKSLTVTDEELAKINKQALEPLEKDEVFTFKVAMSDNSIDREYEVFTLSSLKKMADLFIGRTMIKDHRRTSDGQVARIYATELVETGKTVKETGEPYTQLIAHCYTLRNETNKGLIDEIRGGIKKEVSVGLRVNKALCSICGIDNMKTSCEHWWGKDYEGETCHFALEDPVDAYELSFVAVPALKTAGTVKSYGSEKSKDLPVTKDDSDALKTLELRAKALDSYLKTKNYEMEGDSIDE